MPNKSFYFESLSKIMYLFGDTDVGDTDVLDTDVGDTDLCHRFLMFVKEKVCQ